MPGDTPTWALVLPPVALVSGGVITWLTTRRKSIADIKVGQQNADTASAVAVSNMVSQLVQVVAKNEELSIRMSTVEVKLKESEEREKSINVKLADTERKARIMARAIIAMRSELKDKDGIIETLLVTIDVADDGNEGVQGTMAKAKKLLHDFSQKYRLPSSHGNIMVDGHIDDSVAMSELIVEEVLAEEMMANGITVIVNGEKK